RILSAPSNFSCIFPIVDNVDTRTIPIPKITQIFLFVTGWMSNVPIAIITTVWATVISEDDILSTFHRKTEATMIISVACQIKFKSIDMCLLFQYSLPSQPLVMQKQRRKRPYRLKTPPPRPRSAKHTEAQAMPAESVRLQWKSTIPAHILTDWIFSYFEL